MTTTNDQRKALEETLNYYDTEFPLEKYPDRENWFIANYGVGFTVKHLRGLAALNADAITKGSAIASLERRIEALRKALSGYASALGDPDPGKLARAALEADDKAK